MKNKHLVSIIMPAYNSEKSLNTAIDSIINQSYSNWELIIVDDFSKDNTNKIIDDCIKKDKRIKKIVNVRNKGAAFSRNIAIKESKGKWIAFLDSDDYWHEKKLEIQTNYMLKNNYYFTFTNTRYITDQKVSFNKKFNIPNSVDFKKLRKHNVIACSSVIIDKKILQYNFIEKNDIHEDYLLWLKILNDGNRAYSIDEELLIYRLSKNSKSGNKLKTIFMTYRVFKELNYSYIKSLFFTGLHSINAYFKKHKFLKVKQ
ncbi:glycosyltransferase family 2 protein [Exiguobacterium sp. s91]|uniref:glycosyltransferase family 2 protein n=1 Tax=Exiguobacterium sp. s91 TaxID=2751199 RepID=UPI001BEB9880|nr:glycosyltransferase family 2 protein [Exiguobacterium sp. s91]